MSWPANTKHVRLVAFLVLVCLAAGLVRRIASSPLSSSPSSSHPDWSARERVQLSSNPDSPTPRVRGRWAAVRASLGLPLLPRAAAFTPVRESDSALVHPDKRASRFDLGRKRRADQAALVRQLPLLHFAPTHDPLAPTGPADTPRQRNKSHHLPDTPDE